MTTWQFQFRARPWMMALAFMAAGVGSGARADGIYVCVDAAGHRELTDTNRPGCKEISMPGAISAPPTTRRAPVMASNGPARAPSNAAAPAAAAAAAASQANFPKVDTAQQRARDDDRRAILTDELRSEERKLAELQRTFNKGEPERNGDERNYAKYQERVANMRDNIGRTEKNVAALRREIANIR